MENFWTELLEKYKLAFTEWVKVTLNQDDIVLVEAKRFDSGNEYFIVSSPWQGILPVTFNNRVAMALPYYFDGLGIGIELKYNVSDSTSGVEIIDTVARKRSYVGEYPDRLAATQAGIQKAFEIREKQLTALQVPFFEEALAQLQIREAKAAQG